MEKLTVKPDTVAEPHEYCINWSEDELTWTIDGAKSGRTVKRTETWNATAGHYDYPQTPSRIMLSLWPAGLPSNGEGTIEWAGGEIDWNSKYMNNGMYGALVTKVTVDCYDPPNGLKNQKSYKYTDMNPTNNTISMSNDLVVLQSLMDTGDNPGSKSDKSSSATSKPTKAVMMVPGGNPGGGGRQDAPVVASEGPAPTSGSSFDNGNSGLGLSSGGASGDSGEFSQGDGSNGDGAKGAASGLREVGGSVLAVVVAICGLLVL